MIRDEALVGKGWLPCLGRVFWCQAKPRSTKSGLKKSECSKIIDDFAALATTEVKKAGKFTIPGLCMIKTRMKPARKAGTRVAFGKTIKVKAAPAKKIVKPKTRSAAPKRKAYPSKSKTAKRKA